MQDVLYETCATCGHEKPGPMLTTMLAYVDARRGPRPTTLRISRTPECVLPLAVLRARFPEATDAEIIAELEAMDDGEIKVRIDGELVVVESAR